MTEWLFAGVGQAHTKIEGGNHFLQEDKPEELVGL